MVEAAITMPIIILSVILFLRLFTFYLEILNTGIKDHEKAVTAWCKFDKPYISVYEKESSVTMLRGGILNIDLNKRIRTKAYLYNEDVIVRAGELIEK